MDKELLEKFYGDNQSKSPNSQNRSRSLFKKLSDSGQGSFFLSKKIAEGEIPKSHNLKNYNDTEEEEEDDIEDSSDFNEDRKELTYEERILGERKLNSILSRNQTKKKLKIIFWKKNYQILFKKKDFYNAVQKQKNELLC